MRDDVALIVFNLDVPRYRADSQRALLVEMYCIDIDYDAIPSVQYSTYSLDCFLPTTLPNGIVGSTPWSIVAAHVLYSSSATARASSSLLPVPSLNRAGTSRPFPSISPLPRIRHQVCPSSTIIIYKAYMLTPKLAQDLVDVGARRVAKFGAPSNVAANALYKSCDL
jgi:hypothetical protein